MSEIGLVTCYGVCAVPDGWASEVSHEINRLYYIHGGTGGYTERGIYHPFRAGWLYYFSYLSDVSLSFDPFDRLVHTYCNFERLPPIVASEVLAFDPRGDASAEAALGVFLAGARERVRRSAQNESIFADGEFTRLGLAASSYLAGRVAEANGMPEVADELLIEVLHVMHERISEPITVKEISALCYMTEDALIRRFRRVLGVTPYAYLRHLRLSIARVARGLGKGYEQIAREVGYSDASALHHAMASEKKR